MSPLTLVALVILVVVVVLIIISPAAGKIIAVSLLALVVGLYFRWAGFRNESLDQAHKYGADVWPTFDYLCVAPSSYKTARSITGHDQPLKSNEVRVVASSSSGKAWVAGTPCYAESRIRLLASWMALFAIPAYWVYVLSRHYRSRLAIPTPSAGDS